MSAAEKTGTHTWAEQEAAIGNAKTTAAMLTAIGTSANQIAALAGANAPSASNVVATMADIPSVPAIPSQANMPTSDQKAALGGTSGTPSASNPYATKATTDLKADLVGGTVPASQLPSYVDDVIEAANYAALPTTGETGKIYVTLDTNLQYRWSGTVYVPISVSLALGETSGTAYRGDRGKTAYDHSQITSGNPHGTTVADLNAVPNSRMVNGHALTADVTVTKSDVGLGNVDNTSDANKPVSTAQATAIAAQTFSAVALTNPYAASPALTPRYVGDSAVNLTSLEVWQATATAASASSWNNISRGFYNGAIITDFNSPVASDCYTAYGTATNAPTSSESFFLHHINSNAGNVSAFQIAIGYTTGKIYTRQKIASTWGSWSVGITQTELGYLAGAIQPIQAQITNLNFFNLMLDNGRWLGSAGQNLDSQVTPSVTYTASTISFSASVGTISSSVAGFSGFVAGMCVVITGSTSNNLMVTVTSADASTITCEFQGGQAFVNESAGASITFKGYAITASTWLSPYNGSTNFKLVGMNIYNNSNSGGTRGYLNEAVTSLHTAMYGYIARYSVESGIAQTTAAVANSNFFVNNGKAFFTHKGSGTFGAWIRFIGGTGTMLYNGDYSIGSSAWVNGKATFNSGTWYQFKAQKTGIPQGYVYGFPDLGVDTVGAKMQIFAPFFISGLIPSNFTWTGPIFNSTPVQ